MLQRRLQIKKHVDNEQGAVLITAIVILGLLTILGFAPMNTVEVETRVAAVERNTQQTFHTANSGIEYGLQMIENSALPTGTYNIGDTTVVIDDLSSVEITAEEPEGKDGKWGAETHRKYRTTYIITSTSNQKGNVTLEAKAVQKAWIPR